MTPEMSSAQTGGNVPVNLRLATSSNSQRRSGTTATARRTIRDAEGASQSPRDHPAQRLISVGIALAKIASSAINGAKDAVSLTPTIPSARLSLVGRDPVNLAVDFNLVILLRRASLICLVFLPAHRALSLAKACEKIRATSKEQACNALKIEAILGWVKELAGSSERSRSA